MRRAVVVAGFVLLAAAVWIVGGERVRAAREVGAARANWADPQYRAGLADQMLRTIVGDNLGGEDG